MSGLKFAQLVLQAHLERNLDEGETDEPETPYLPLLTSRALHIALQELLNIRELRFSSHIPHRLAQKQQLEAIGQLKCLKYADLGGEPEGQQPELETPPNQETNLHH